MRIKPTNATKTSLLFIILFNTVFHLHSYSQSNFQKGYIITQSLDTIYGYIDNKSYSLNSQHCDFRESTGDAVIRYEAGSLHSYRFLDGKYYISENLNGEPVFLEFLIKGELDIYFYKDKDQGDHYYASKDSLPLYELKYIEGIKKINGKNTAFVSKPYAGYLNYLTYDCPEIKDDILSLKMSHKNLIKFAEDYHNIICEDDHCMVYEKKIPRKIKFNLQNGYAFPISNKYDLSPDNRYLFGFHVMFQQAQEMENLYLGIGLYNNQMEGDFIRLRIPFSVSYIKNNEGFSPFYSFELDMDHFMMAQAVLIGMKYQIKKVSATLHADLRTLWFVKPYAYSFNFGLAYDLR